METFYTLKQARENGAILLTFRFLSPNLTTYTCVNESKSLIRVSGQDPLIYHRFRSSQRWCILAPEAG